MNGTDAPKEWLTEPTTPEEVLALHEILRADPQRYLRITNRWIEENSENHQAYFDRHFAWMKIDEPNRAIADLDKAIQLHPSMAAFFARALVHRHLGQYQQARQDFDLGEAINPNEWASDVFGLYYQADTHARLGDEAQALACCERLPRDFWTPGVDGAPRGGKTEIAEELRRRAAEARTRR